MQLKATSSGGPCNRSSGPATTQIRLSELHNWALREEASSSHEAGTIWKAGPQEKPSPASIDALEYGFPGNQGIATIQYVAHGHS